MTRRFVQPGRLRACFLALAVLSVPQLVRADLADSIDQALVNATNGEYGPALDLGTRLIARDPTDWHGWYLRSLGLRARSLTGAEQQVLEAIRPTERREAIRGLVGYVLSPSSSRLLLARDLVERLPSQGLVHALLASSLLAAGQPDAARDAASTALTLDPEMLLAARIEVSALAALHDPTDHSSLFCELMDRFPHDSLVVREGLMSCRPDDDPALRLHQFGALLVAQRGEAASVIALSRILTGKRKIGADVLLSILERLDPRDEAWWIHGEQLLEHLERSPEIFDACAARTFLERWTVAASEGSSLTSPAILEHASLALARSLGRDGRFPEARELLGSTLERLPALRRRGHLEELARLEREQGLWQAAEGHELDLHVLTHPFELPPANRFSTRVTMGDVETRMRLSFPRIEPTVLVRADGNEQRFEPEHPRPRLVVFWTSHCVYVAREAKRIRSLLANPSSVLRRHDVDVLWINMESENRRGAARERIEQLGLDRERVLFERGDDPSPLHARLGVAGSPWVGLITEQGEVVYEMKSFNEAGWMADVESILSALEAWKRNTGLVTEGR